MYAILVGRRVLVDAGQDGFPEYIKNLSDLLKEQEVSIAQIIITHWHQDHIGGLTDLEPLLHSMESLKTVLTRDCKGN